MAKMFYTIDEVKTMLGLNDEAIRALVQEGKLRELLDGARRVFKAEQVEALAAQAPPRGSSAPTETDASGFALEMTDTAAGASGSAKADTALGGEGIQDLGQDQDGLADTDAVSKGSGSSEGILQLDGSGSGSGLLDLTREGDDTSLGAVLDEIYPGEDETAAGVAAGMGTGLASALGSGMAEAQGIEQAPAMAEQMQVSPGRAARPFVAAMILAVVLLGLAISALVAVLQGVTPVYLTILFDNLLYFLMGSMVVAVVIFVFGAIFGRRRV
ncbi:MAG: hypothetical protein GWP14_06790 [Actinobacteria bacterium]|nr:hypothetical protein [Actinomycetota bacterium]